jgi:hypothetical protein
MIQQINLYQPMLRQPKRIFSALTILQIWSVVALALVVLSGFGQWRVGALAGRLTGLENHELRAKQRFKDLQLALPKKNADPTLAARAQVMDIELAQAQLLAEALTTGILGNTEGFSVYLEALARQHVTGTWLTRIEVTQGGSAIGLSGHALAPELVPEYIQRLNREPVFKGKMFSQLSLSRAPDSLDFNLATIGVTPTEDPAPHARR